MLPDNDKFTAVTSLRDSHLNDQDYMIQVTVSTRRGTWVFNRVNQGGMPYDTKLFTRLYDFLMDRLPWTILNDFMEHRLQVTF